MNVLIVGANTKMAKVFATFANTLLLTEPSFRFYREIEEFYTIKSRTNIFSFSGGIKRFFELYKISKSKDIDLIFTNDKTSMISAFFVKKLTKKRILLLSTSHNSYAWLDQNKVKLFTKLIKISTNGYISLSTHVTEMLVKYGLNRNKIFTTVNPIEENSFKIKRNYSLRDKISIIYVAVIYKGKGQDILLSAVNYLKNKGLNISVNLFGEVVEKSYYEELLNFINQNNLFDNIVFHGKIDNSHLRNLLCEYDIYVCPSEMEMSPYNIIEAKSAGLPIIASNVGGISDIISNEYDGILVKPNCPESLSNSINRLINDKILRENIGHNAFASSITKHSANRIAKSLQNFILKL